MKRKKIKLLSTVLFMRARENKTTGLSIKIRDLRDLKFLTVLNCHEVRGHNTVCCHK